MDTFDHNLRNLFKQLGLEQEYGDLDTFLRHYQGTLGDQRLEDAEFWNISQRQFICESLAEDADWSEALDQLNVMLH